MKTKILRKKTNSEIQNYLAGYWRAIKDENRKALEQYNLTESDKARATHLKDIAENFEREINDKIDTKEVDLDELYDNRKKIYILFDTVKQRIISIHDEEPSAISEVNPCIRLTIEDNDIAAYKVISK